MCHIALLWCEGVLQIITRMALDRAHTSARLNSLFCNLLKGRICICIWIFTKIESICPCLTPNLSKFHLNPFTTFWDILLADRKTDKRVKTQLPSTFGGGGNKIPNSLHENNRSGGIIIWNNKPCLCIWFIYMHSLITGWNLSKTGGCIHGAHGKVFKWIKHSGWWEWPQFSL